MSRKGGKLKLNTRSKGGRSRQEKDLWEEFSVLGSENSIAYREEMNLPAILSHPTAQAIFASVSNQKVSTLLTSGEITRTVTEFKADGAAGKHDSHWIAEAMVASERRAMGDYDEFLRAQFLRDWGDEGGEIFSDSDDKTSLTTKKKDKKAKEGAKSSIFTDDSQFSPVRNVKMAGGIGGYDGASSPKTRAGDSSPLSELSELGSSPSGSFFNGHGDSPSLVPEDNGNSVESTSNCLQLTEIHDDRTIPDSEQYISLSASPAPIASDLVNP